MSGVLFAFRQLRRAPAHIAAVILSLGIGMAICGAVFSAVDTLLFAAVPGIVDRNNLLHIRWVAGNGLLTPNEFDAIEHKGTLPFRTLGAQGERIAAVLLPSGAATLRAAFVSGRFFETLGTRPIRGRLLTPSDVRPGAWPVAVIGESLWRRSFGSDPHVVGQTLSMAGRSFTVVGVVPERFAGLRLIEFGDGDANVPQVWLPLSGDSRDAAWLAVAGRLVPGNSLEAVRSLLSLVGAQVASTSAVTRQPAVLRAFRAALDWQAHPWESVMSMGVFLMVPLALLAIGCANVVNLQLARATERTRELSVRLTLGASRGQIVRLLSIEVCLLALLACTVGWGGARLLISQGQPLLPAPVTLDTEVLLFFLVLVTAVIAAAGLAPAWLASRDVIAVGLRESPASLPHKRLRGFLVIVQIGASLVLLFMTALGARTLQKFGPNLPGDAKNILVSEVNLAEIRPTDPRSATFVHDVLTQLNRQRSIRAAGFSTFFRVGSAVRYWGAADHSEIHRIAYSGAITEGWSDAIGLRVLAGRGLNTSHTELDVVVNETLASALGGSTSVLGSVLRVSRRQGQIESMRIIGIVQDQSASDMPMVLSRMPSEPPPSLVLAVRAADRDRAIEAVRAAVANADPSVPHDRIVSLDSKMAEAFGDMPATVWLGAGITALSVLLASVGLYAVLSFTVRRRTREIGIRVAVGATRQKVVWLVLRQGLTLVMAGAVCGFAIAVPLTYIMRSAFVGLSPVDPGAMLPTIGVMLLVSAVASVLPVYRALRIEPTLALRDE